MSASILAFIYPSIALVAHLFISLATLIVIMAIFDRKTNMKEQYKGYEFAIAFDGDTANIAITKDGKRVHAETLDVTGTESCTKEQAAAVFAQSRIDNISQGLPAKG